MSLHGDVHAETSFNLSLDISRTMCAIVSCQDDFMNREIGGDDVNNRERQIIATMVPMKCTCCHAPLARSPWPRYVAAMCLASWSRGHTQGQGTHNPYFYFESNKSNTNANHDAPDSSLKFL